MSQDEDNIYKHGRRKPVMQIMHTYYLSDSITRRDEGTYGFTDVRVTFGAAVWKRAWPRILGLLPWMISSCGAEGPGRPAPPACGRRRLAAHSTSPDECRPACHRRPRPWRMPSRRLPPQGQDSSLQARRELRPASPRVPCRRSARIGRAQCRSEQPWR